MVEWVDKSVIIQSGDYGAMKVGGHELRGGIAYFSAFYEQVRRE